MKPQFTKLLQIGIIVSNVDESIENYEKIFGTGPWWVTYMDKNNFPRLTIDGKPSDIVNKCAFCNAYGMEIELIEPLSDSVYKAWLDEHGPGIHHVAMLTRDNFDEVVAQSKVLTGKDPWNNPGR